MQLKHLASIASPGEGVVKVTCLCWAPNGKRLAVCTTDRVVLMFDENGIRKDKFPTKPAEKVETIRERSLYVVLVSSSLSLVFRFKTHRLIPVAPFLPLFLCKFRDQKII
jgi:intraflagellar transport protein 172